MAELDYEEIATLLKVLGNPTRVMIVKELSTGEQCVCDLENKLEISQANVSQHLNILRVNGIVNCIRQGNSRCYYLKQPDFIKRLFELIEDNERSIAYGK
ncbi:MAG: metalloregulator ArsR/SmtB family transcription factor [Thermodesulfobacteriota bacterium]|nr:metalloregulator ArsR/SmtB family transcription factor [Thermodesulfobacteriota bacterium]